MSEHIEFWAPCPPETPLEAAQDFYQSSVPAIREILTHEGAVESITIRFPRADYTHRGWRLAAIQQVARELAPVRVNAIAGGTEQAIDDARAYLVEAPGITGQLLEL